MTQGGSLGSIDKSSKDKLKPLFNESLKVKELIVIKEPTDENTVTEPLSARSLVKINGLRVGNKGLLAANSTQNSYKLKFNEIYRKSFNSTHHDPFLSSPV